jgi:hypothetical protein
LGGELVKGHVEDRKVEHLGDLPVPEIAADFLGRLINGSLFCSKVFQIIICCQLLSSVDVPLLDPEIQPVVEGHGPDSEVQNLKDFLFHLHYLIASIAVVSGAHEVSHSWWIYFFEF